MRKLYYIFLFVLCFTTSFAQKDSLNKVTKKGWTFGAVPAIAYDSDIGFRYGGLVSLYDYGDGSRYPEYKHSTYLELSRTTKGSGLAKIKYDSKYLIPKIRTSLDIAYLTEQALDFFGFNGYQAAYNPNFVDDQHQDYLSRMYYKHERKQFLGSIDFIGNIYNKRLLWVGGLVVCNNKIATVDINKLNKGKADDKQLPDTKLLYDKYVDWGVIAEDEKNGGHVNLLKMGLIYDTRDNESNPMTGIWSELLLLSAPDFINKDNAYTQLAITHRQYFTLKKEVLNFAYRVGYQATIMGNSPFYMKPLVYYSNKSTRDALGGGRNLRGILRNRIVGDDFLYANVELRYKFYRDVVFNQNIYTALSLFTDAGMVTSSYHFDKKNIPDDYTIEDDKETLHQSLGLGLHVVLNDNFVLSINYGRALDKRDGVDGMYINLGFLF